MLKEFQKLNQKNIVLVFYFILIESKGTDKKGNKYSCTYFWKKSNETKKGMITV